MIRALLRIVIGVGALVAANVPAEVGDIAFTRKSAGTDDVPAATFPHYVHRMQFKCYVCHEDIFVMKAGANAMTMDEMQDGKYCGVCHNGKMAFQATFNTCPRCHRPQ